MGILEIQDVPAARFNSSFSLKCFHVFLFSLSLPFMTFNEVREGQGAKRREMGHNRDADWVYGLY